MDLKQQGKLSPTQLAKGEQLALDRLANFKSEMRQWLNTPEHVKDGVAGILATSLLEDAIRGGALEKENGEELLKTVLSTKGLSVARREIQESTVFQAMVLNKSDDDLKKMGKASDLQNSYIKKVALAQKSGHVKVNKPKVNVAEVTKTGKGMTK